MPIERPEYQEETDNNYPEQNGIEEGAVVAGRYQIDSAEGREKAAAATEQAETHRANRLKTGMDKLRGHGINVELPDINGSQLKINGNLISFQDNDKFQYIDMSYDSVDNKIRDILGFQTHEFALTNPTEEQARRKAWEDKNVDWYAKQIANGLLGGIATNEKLVVFNWQTSNSETNQADKGFFMFSPKTNKMLYFDESSGTLYGAVPNNGQIEIKELEFQKPE